MQHIGNCKLHVMTAHLSQNRGDVTTEALDTIGFNEAIIVFSHASGTGAMDGVQLQECDTRDGTYKAINEATAGHADCVGIDGTAIVKTDTDTNESIVFYIDLRKRDRFLNIYIDNNTTTCRWAIYGLLGSPSNLGAITNANMVLSESAGTEAYCTCRMNADLS